MNYYRNTRKTSKKRLNYKYNNDKQNLTTKENENTECQKARIRAWNKKKCLFAILQKLWKVSCKFKNLSPK